MKHNYISLLCFIFLAPFIFLHQAEKTYAHELGISISYAQIDSQPVACIDLTFAAPYHAYAHIPGGTGKPTVLTLQTFESPPVRATVRYPRGLTQRDVFTPTQMVQIYEGTVSLFVDLPGARPGQAFTARVDALLCSDKHCLPLTQRFSLRLPDTALPPLRDMPWADSYTQATPGSSPPEALALNTALPALGDLDSSAPLPTVPLRPLPTTEKKLAPQPEANTKTPWNFTPQFLQEENEVSGLGKALLLGLLAGLLLNVMPCVLPVLTMKASAILVVGGGDTHERFRRFREHSLLFAAGIMTLFLFLAILLGTAEMIWGQLFQNPWVILGMLTVVFLLGLSMLGVFTLPVIDLKAAQSSSPRLQAYFTGIIATLLATPCSGPLLGGVLGWAFMQPLPILITVFLAVGIGMSTPYLLFAARPQLVTVLPKPGAWMGVLEKLVGFFLLATSIYLLSILSTTLYIPVISILLVVAMCAWLYGRYGAYDAPPRRRLGIKIGSVLSIALVACVALWPSNAVTHWENFNPATFRAMLGREAMVVEFTADWCPNCKLLEQSTLTPKNLQRWQDTYHTRFIRVDLTREDPAAQQFLQALGSSSIPLTALFPVGPKASSPLILRDIYTTSNMDDALQQFFSHKND